MGKDLMVQHLWEIDSINYNRRSRSCTVNNFIRLKKGKVAQERVVESCFDNVNCIKKITLIENLSNVPAVTEKKEGNKGIRN